MSSGFVSAGTDQEPVERDDEWRRAQQELEEERRRKAELGRQDGGKSLYEVLQQNKMAKQDAFEEKMKLKNQFRALDDDEVEFLDSLLESTRAQEATVKRETAEQLELFRRQREEAEKVHLEDSSANVTPATEGEDWKIPTRKRRREKELLIPGKKRKSLGGNVAEKPTVEQKVNQKKDEEPPRKITKDNLGETQERPAANKDPSPPVSGPVVDTSTKNTKPEGFGLAQPLRKQSNPPPPPPSPPPPRPPSTSLGLAGYSSDSE